MEQGAMILFFLAFAAVLALGVGLALALKRVKALREALQEQRGKSENHFRALAEDAPDIITILSETGLIRYTSPAARKVIGYDPEELQGKNAFEFVHQADLPHVLKRFSAAVNDPGVPYGVEFRFRHRDGSWVSLEAIGRYRPGGDQDLGMVVNSRDITERKRTERKVHGLLDAIPDGIIMINGRQKMVLVNREAERMFGYAKDELLDKPVEVIIPERFRENHESGTMRFFSHPQTRHIGDGLKIFGLRKDGTEFPMQLGLSPVVTDEELLVIAVIRQIVE